ncbi:MAG: MFS transporter [Anaerolineales bacterium]|nr:MFS transporter [Anaerolineales bacterium]MCA9926917.1 MFS transporter [Anaerolineales bacterium]
MITEKSRRYKLSLFFILYFVQGVLFAYMSLFHKPYLDSQGISADQIAWLNVVVLSPFILKILFGVVSDRINLFGRGHRLPYIILGIVLSVIAFGTLAFIAPRDGLLPFGILLTVFIFSIALMDSSADGLAVDTTATGDRQAVQASMLVGRFGAIIIMALLFGAIAQRMGYTAAFLISAVFLALPLLWVLQLHEPAERPVEQAFQWSALKAILTPAYGVVALLSLAFGAFVVGVVGIFTFYMSKELGANSDQVGLYGAINSLGIILGAAVSVPLLRRFPQFRVQMGLFLLWSLVLLVWGIEPSMGLSFVLGGIAGLIFGMINTVYLGIAMERTQTQAAGTIFALTMALLNIGLAVGDAVFTGLTDNIGFGSVFLLQGGLSLLLLLLLWAVQRTESTTG